MSLLSLQFRAVAAQLKVLEQSNPNLSFPRVKQLVQNHLGREFERALYSRQDMEDPYTYWDLLLIDAVLLLEDHQGNMARVAVYVVPNEYKAHKAIRTVTQPAQFRVRQQLGINYYWVLCLDAKKFPRQGQWIDLIYAEIDRQGSQKACRLIEV
ncbi:hypothetical protein [Picosynechococcus sp. NKBG042902]|uniref:hypothetical protein n=1 Tax=Picosynechococcus sp. NKBG042902 TaxID=490193 RepID=UPI0004AB557D|nr:hypothetical protein [Picosynechococcus sp. NKBG042902]